MRSNYFEPIIGSSFDNIAAQRAGWSRFNQSVDESNLGRAAEAQRTRNNWLAQVAQMQQADADRQTQREQDAATLSRQQGRQQYEDTESRRRFDIGTKLTEGQQALEKQHWDFNQNERNKAERKQLDLAENFGKAKSSEANDLGKKLDDATVAYNQSKGDLDKALSRIQGKYSGVTWDNRSKLFISRDPKVNPENVKAANDEFSDAKAEADRAAIDFSTAHEAYLNLQKEASSYGLTVQRVGNRRVLFSPAHNKTFGDTGNDSSSNDTAPGWLPRSGSGMGDLKSAEGSASPDSATTPYAGFTSGTGTTPSLSSPPVRRYNPATGLIE